MAYILCHCFCISLSPLPAPLPPTLPLNPSPRFLLLRLSRSPAPPLSSSRINLSPSSPSPSFSPAPHQPPCTVCRSPIRCRPSGNRRGKRRSRSAGRGHRPGWTAPLSSRMNNSCYTTCPPTGCNGRGTIAAWYKSILTIVVVLLWVYDQY